jgi:hypothetical protein
MREWIPVGVMWRGSPCFRDSRGSGWSYEDSGERLVSMPASVASALEKWWIEGRLLQGLSEPDLTRLEVKRQ